LTGYFTDAPKANEPVTESLTHAAMHVEMGLPALAALVWRVSPGVLLLNWLGVAAHTVTAYIDVGYTDELRAITATEQHVHTLLESMPFVLVSLLTALYPKQAVAALRRSATAAEEPLAKSGVRWVYLMASLLAGLPYLEELWRWREANSDARRARHQAICFSPREAGAGLARAA